MKTAAARILLSHGAGGRLSHELVQTLFKPAFSNPVLNALDDAAAVKTVNGTTLAFTTDAFVVTPLVFPGGDIGKLSVCGTVNDLAMKGAVPLALSVAAVIEEGFDLALLADITRSMAAAAKEAKVNIVTGDTKVVEKGKADRLFITTSGIGLIPKGISISGKNACPGDAVLINGTIADHGTAVLLARNDFKLSARIESDCAPLNGLVRRLLATTKTVHVLRDPTRGGVATTLNEIAAASGAGIIIEEKLMPVKPEVRAACNILGLDPLYVANEGKMLAILPDKTADAAVRALKKDRYGKGATRIGRVVRSPRGVWLKTAAGGLRPLQMLEGEQLPRIC